MAQWMRIPPFRAFDVFTGREQGPARAAWRGEPTLTDPAVAVGLGLGELG